MTLGAKCGALKALDRFCRRWVDVQRYVFNLPQASVAVDSLEGRASSTF
jgi:hypothetical protein